MHRKNNTKHLLAYLMGGGEHINMKCQPDPAVNVC